MSYFIIEKSTTGNFYHIYNNERTRVNVSDFDIVLDDVSLTFIIQCKNGSNIPSQAISISLIQVIDLSVSGTPIAFIGIDGLIQLLKSISYTPYLNTQAITEPIVIYKKGQVGIFKVTQTWIDDNFDSTGLGKLEALGWAKRNGSNLTLNQEGKFSLNQGDVPYNVIGAVGGYTDSIVVAHSHVEKAGTSNVGTQSVIVAATGSGTNATSNFTQTFGESGVGRNMPPYLIDLWLERVTDLIFYGSGSGVQSVVAGTNITVDNTDPLNPIISSTGGGGTQTLAQTLVIGKHTGGNNIIVDNADAIELENTSLLKKGTYDFGGAGGISRICSVGYEDMWQSGIHHVFDNNGFIRHSTNCFNYIPDISYDASLRFKVGSLWTLDDGTTYKCTDASGGGAVWEIENLTLPKVIQNGDLLMSYEAVSKNLTSADLGKILHPTVTTSIVYTLDNHESSFKIGTSLFFTSGFTIAIDTSIATSILNNVIFNGIEYSDGGLIPLITGNFYRLLKFDGDDTTYGVWLLTMEIGSLSSVTPTLDEVLTKGSTATAKTVVFYETDINLYTMQLRAPEISFLNDGNQEGSYLSSSMVGFGNETTQIAVELGAFGLQLRDSNLNTNSTLYFTPPTGLGTILIPDVVNDTKTLATTDDLPAAQIQSDWNQTNNALLDYIKNKPSIPSLTGVELQANKQNSLTVDGTGVKYPTVDAVNAGLVDVNTNAVDRITVKLSTAINKGQAVYVSSANGTNIIVSKASNATEATSSKTLGLLETTGATNAIVNVITSGLLGGLDTSTATIGDPVWLGTSGNLIFGLANKPVAPAHLVTIGIVSRVSATVGEIIVRVQNGFELNEIHDVAITSVANEDFLQYESSTSLWKNIQLTASWIRSKLGITTLSGSNTGDQDLSGYELISNKGVTVVGNETSTTKYLSIKGVYDWATDLFLTKIAPSFTGILTGVGTTQTGSSAIGVVNLSQTWNTTGTVTALKLNVANIASAGNALVFDFQVNGSSLFSLSKFGNLAGSAISTLTFGKFLSNASGNSGSNVNIYDWTPSAFNNVNSTTFNIFSAGPTFNPTSSGGIYNGFSFSSIINQTGTASGITRGLYINPTLTSAIDFRAIEVTAGKLLFSSTIIAPGTTGAATINKISGKVNAAAGATSLVVTNSLVTASSIVMCQLGTNDATCVIKSVVEASGSFTINFIAPTAETVIKFKVIN